MTTYNPMVNGMVERVHCSMKASLMARCTDENWKSQLPWLLLGLRTATRAKGEVSPTKKVYGEILAVPGEFFPTNNSNQDTPITRLCEVAGKFTPCVRTFTNRTKCFKLKGLDTCSYIFVRNDAHRPPLMRPYRGSYRVMKTSPKAYYLMIHGQEVWVTIDRLKPIFLLVDDNDAPNTEKGHTRVLPQNKPSSARCNQPRRQTVEHPRNAAQGRLLVDNTSEVSASDNGPHPHISRTWGCLRPPQRY
ncbi:uncharacterized protein [Palaemon carinicauda]|uniref:uncharacterized protein n=1 Tax=Palaemon carinicauda TaxID=392227 RepID=UPI0035B6031E